MQDATFTGDIQDLPLQSRRSLLDLAVSPDAIDITLDGDNIGCDNAACGADCVEDFMADACRKDNGVGGVASGSASDPVSWLPKVPPEFRLQIKLLEMLTHQGKHLQQLAEQGQQIKLQIAGLEWLSTRSFQQNLNRTEDARTSIEAQLRAIHEVVDRGFRGLRKDGQVRSGDPLPFDSPCRLDSLACLPDKTLARRAEDRCARNLKQDAVAGCNGATVPNVCSQPPKKSVSTHHSCAKMKRMNKSNSKLSIHGAASAQDIAALISNSHTFEITSAAVICLNAITIGIFVQYDLELAFAVDESKQQHFTNMLDVIKNINYFFCAFYAIELAIKMFAFRIQFFCGPEFRWNLFDLFLVVFGILYVVIDILQLGSFTNLTVMRLARILRITRWLRLVRVLRMFKELRTMVSSIVGSLQTLAWSLLMFPVVMYIFGLCFMMGASEYLQETPRDQWDEQAANDIQLYWGTIGESMCSLFQAVTGGDDWSTFALPLKAVGLPYFLLFMFYISFASLALLNILTGMFLDSTQKAAEADQKDIIEETFAACHDEIADFTNWCQNIDNAGTGTLTWKHIKENVDDPAVRSFLDAMQLGPSDVKNVFMKNHKLHPVRVDELVSSCARARDHELAIDMESLESHSIRILDQQRVFMEYVEDMLMKFHNRLCPGQAATTPLNKRFARQNCAPNRWRHEEDSPSETDFLGLEVQ